MLSELHSQRKEYTRYIRPDWFKAPGRINYEDIKDVSDEDIRSVFDKFDAINRANDDVRRHNRELAKQARTLFLGDLKEMGINAFGVRGGLNKPYSDTVREIEYAITGRGHPAKPSPSFYNKGVEVSVYNGSIADRIVKFKQRCFQLIENEIKHTKLFRAACEYISINKIDVPESESAETVINAANQHAERAYVESNYPDGTELEAAGCDYCSTWFVGDRRCSCGNRRQYLEVDGNIQEGFHAYPQPF